MANTDLYQFTVVLINSDPIIHQLSKIPRVNSQLPIIGFLKFMHYFVFLGNMGHLHIATNIFIKIMKLNTV